MQIAIGYCLVKRFGQTQMNTTHTANGREIHIKWWKKPPTKLFLVFVFVFMQTLFHWNFNLLSEVFFVGVHQTFSLKSNFI